MKIPDILYKMADILHKNNYQCYLVGGAVRDTLLKKKVKDYDLATDAYPGDVQRIFRRVVPTGIKHGTVTVLLGGEQFEVTTFRIEGKYTDSRRPDSVTFTPSIEEDLSRRDFTINAIAWDLIKKGITDPFKGRDDLKNGIIRAIGNPKERFDEDGLRLLRACRFAAQLGYTIEEKTLQAICDTAGNIAAISMERIRDELVKIILSGSPVTGLELIRTCGMMSYFLPELEKCAGIAQRERHEFDVYQHSIYACEGGLKDSPEVRMAALLHDIGKAETRGVNDFNQVTFCNHQSVSAELADEILKRLKFPNDFRKDVTHLIKHHMFNYTGDWSDSAVRRFIARVGREYIAPLIEVRKADKYGRSRKPGDTRDLAAFIDRMGTVIQTDTALAVKDLEINGKDLMTNLSLPPGKNIGTILKFLLEAVIDDPVLNEKGKLLEMGGKFYHERLEV